ncbi:MAG: helix-turn-helix domain-containing protein [Trueperaceae bacterium]|nr:helix-turn-helix domain-containing protein [Trueperaceae bacterium]
MHLEDLGFTIYRGEVLVMPAAHRHQEIEFNLIFEGSITYVFGGDALELSQGHLALFWATTPHHLITCAPQTDCGWITLPLATFLRYGLPEKLARTILQGGVFIESFDSVESSLFNRWLEDVKHPTEEKQTILDLELEAWLRRMALSQPSVGTHHASGIDTKTAQLARYISEHYQEPISLECIAAAASLNPSYAATLFRKSFGMTLNDYLTQHRVAHAQRLLVTTDLPILELAFEAGFGSSSQFYAAFSKTCKQTPRSYRQSHTHKS